MSPQEAARIVAYLSAAFPGSKIDAERAALYSLMLVPLERDEAEQAAAELALTGHWFPSLGDFHEKVLRRRLALPTLADARVQIIRTAEWGLNPVGDPPALHPLVAEALRLMGGAYALRNSERPEAWWAHFRTLYADLDAKAVREENLRSSRLPLTYERGVYPVADLGDALAENRREIEGGRA